MTTTKLSKKLRTEIMTSVITSTYKGRFESLLLKLEEFAYDHCVKNSQNDFFRSLNLTNEQKNCVKMKVAIDLAKSINVEKVCFLDRRFINNIKFQSIVYGYTGDHYLQCADAKEYMDIVKLIEEIEHEQNELSEILNVYTNVKKLIEDLPFIGNHISLTPTTCTTVIAIDTINAINAKYGV